MRQKAEQEDIKQTRWFNRLKTRLGINNRRYASVAEIENANAAMLNRLRALEDRYRLAEEELTQLPPTTQKWFEQNQGYITQ